MEHSVEVNELCPISRGPKHASSPISMEGKFRVAKDVRDISGFTHGAGWGVHPGRVSVNCL